MSEALTLRASTACPSCRIRHVVDVTLSLRAKPPGSYSIAGAWPKVVAEEVWTFTCTRCGASGPAAGPCDATDLAGRPIAACGHVEAVVHYPTEQVKHARDMCSGCCMACQELKDGIPWN